VRKDSDSEGDHMAGPAEAFVLAPGEGRPIDLGTFGMTVKASWDETDGVFSLLEAAEPPDFGPPLHIHHDAAEAFYVLEGEYLMFLDDREVSCPAGSFIYIPAGMPHGFRVGAASGRKLNFYFPAAMLGYFDDLSAAIRRSEVDESVLADVARRHSMEIVGPVPESYT
jgi:mannose-6-phosphate isomerase-like protein (cupin superfamily)